MDDLLTRLVAATRTHPLPHPALKAIALAQWLLESGRATSALAREYLNFGGLKWRAEMAPFATGADHVAHDRRDGYCRFLSIAAFIAGYWAFLGRRPYAGWERFADDPAGFIRFIAPIYTPTAGYADRVLALLPEAERLLRQTDLGTIVLDPGHGGTANLPGSSANNAISASGVTEKALTLAFGLTLRDSLLDQARAAGERLTVLLTRDTDVNLAGEARAGLAGKAGGRAFLSLHFNGSGNQTVRGTETFWRAAENGNVNPAPDIAFAQAVQGGLIAGWRVIDPAARDRGAKPDTQSGPRALGVLNDRALGNVGRARPAVAALAEIEFITHPGVDRLIASGTAASANRATIAASLASAIRRQLDGV